MTAATRWFATRALSRGVGVGAAAGAVGVWAGRVDVAAAGGALLLAVALAGGSGRPRSRATVRAVAPAAASAGDVVALVVTATTPPGTELLAVRLPAAVTGRSDRSAVVAPTGPETRLERRFVVAGWGSLRLARPDWLAATADGLFVTGPVEAREVRVAVVPAAGDGGGVLAPPRSSGHLGSHRARAQGDGSQVSGVREYRPGDLLRRIDWRVSNRRLAALHPAMRRGSLYVRTMAAETEGAVLLLVDTRLDIAPAMAAWDLDLSRRGAQERRDPWLVALWRAVHARWGASIWRRAVARPEAAVPTVRPAAAAAGGSLDATVEAAVAVATEHILVGDRVTLIDLGRPRSSLPAGSGRRHLDRIRFRLSQVAVDKSGVWRPGSLSATVTPMITRAPLQSVAVVVSAFYDADVVDLTVSLAHAGRSVRAVDTAPHRVTSDARVPRSAEALALVAAERGRRLRRLADAGVRISAPGDAVGRRP